MLKPNYFTNLEAADIEKAFETIYRLLVAWEAQVSATVVGSIIHGTLVSRLEPDQRKRIVKLTERFTVAKGSCRSYAKAVENRYLLAECLAGNNKTIAAAIELFHAIMLWTTHDRRRYNDARTLAVEIDAGEIFSLSKVEEMTTIPILDLIEKQCEELLPILGKQKDKDKG